MTRMSTLVRPVGRPTAKALGAASVAASVAAFLASFLAAFLAAFLAFAAVALVPGVARAAPAAEWAPAASERLVKLPGDFLKKAVDTDFAKSGLATALADAEERLSAKRQTLADLQAAVDAADGDARLELAHRFVVEKRAFIGLSKTHQDLRRRHARTKVRLYESLLGKLNRKQRAETPARAHLIARQSEVRERFRASITEVDARLLRSSVGSESRYAKDYAENAAAIDSLVAAINVHPMNAEADADGGPKSRADTLRRLIASSEADLAIIDQEGAILGHMAKLVSLDALALSADLRGETETSDATTDPGERLTGAIDHFVSR